MIYLDSSSTTKPKQEVIYDIMRYLTDMWYNPSSLYYESAEVKKKIEIARNNIGEFIGGKGDEIYFCSCGSEANCMMIQGFIKRCHLNNVNPIIITSVIEHKSILDCVEDMKNLKYSKVYFVNVDEYGLINLDELEGLLKQISENDRALVSIQFANNEIGTCQHVKIISDLVHMYGGIFHTDAVQCVGQFPINVKELGIDALSMSGHKIYAPKGIGFLYKKKDININPIIYGSQMNGMRGGTENVPYIIGLNKALEYCDISNEKIIEMCNKRDYFIFKLENKFNCRINGHRDFRLPNNINVTFLQNITGESLLYMLDMAGIKVSTGSACNSHSIEPSHILKAIKLSDEDAMKTIRFTISEDTTYDDIDNVIKEIDKAIKIISL